MSAQFTSEWLMRFQMRNALKLTPNAVECPPEDAAEREIEEIHQPIIAWCKNQMPQVPFIRARSDRESTIANGCQDFTIFYRGKAWCFEAKRKGAKLKPDQLAWKILMDRQSFVVHVIYSFREFLDIINTEQHL